MRFATALAVPLLLASSALADSCSSYDDNGNDSPLFHPKPVKKVPKLKATKQNLDSGVAQAVQGLANSNVLPPAVAGSVQSAIQQVIAKAANTNVALAAVTTGGTTKTITVAKSTQTVTKTTTKQGMTVTDVVTQTVTALPPGATILPNETLIALNDIQQSINDAIAAVNLSETGLDAATQSELSACLTAVVENGGLPAGYSCISQSGSTSSGLKATFANVLEQFLGILPAKLIDDLQNAVMPMLSGLLPSETTLLNNINAAMASVVASLSGNSVTAIEMMQSCYTLAIKQNANTSYLQCYMSDGGPFDTLETAMNSVIQQFVGYLPGTIITSVQNLTASTLQAGAYANVDSIGTNLTQQLNNALKSVTSSLTGNAVTLMEELQACANKLLQDGDATAAQNCIVTSPAAQARTMVDSVAEQFSGYLPSSFFSDLVSIVENMNSTGNFTQGQIIGALDQAFNNANIGPAYVGCFHQVQDCVLAEIQATGNYSSVCPGPVTGCELIGSQNSTSLANTTASASPAAAVVALNSTSSSSVSSTSSVGTGTASPVAAFAAANAVSSSVSSSSAKSSSSAHSASSIAPSSSASSAPAASSASSMASPSSAPSSSLAASSSSSSSSAHSAAPASSSSVAAPASSSSAAPSQSAAPTARMAKRITPLRRSHAKLRFDYDTHYQRL